MGQRGKAHELHFEPFVHLVDVTDEAALVAWGGFFLRRDDAKGWFVVDDDDLPDGRTAGGTIGAESAPYGAARVEVCDEDGVVVSSATTAEHNHVWVEGLQPDRTYRYRISVDGRAWAEGERCDWRLDGGGGALVPSRRYDLRLRTHPRSDDPVPVAVLAIGDYGVGIVNGDDGARQLAVARSLERLADRHAVRALVSLGDNIYHGPEDQLAQSGDEDDDWYFTFYAPYRYLIDHLPMYPTAGNHDGADEEDNDDRAQLEDNFHLAARFQQAEAQGLASCDPGLFYRVPIGGLLELVCVDTTWGDDIGHHFYEDDKHQRWLEDSFPAVGDGTGVPPWRIPFCHHPPWCAGPDHDGQIEQLESLIPRYRRAGVRLVLSGHEHNFQHGTHEGLHSIVSGAGAKLDLGRPTQWTTAETQAWAAEAHCLLIEAEPSRLVVTPWGVPGDDGEPVALVAEDRAGDRVEAGLTIPA